jgi:hypothetical protein
LNSLQELRLFGCFDLKDITMAPKARLQKLWINAAPKLRPDWRRLGRDLKALTIIGKTSSALDELRHARKLKNLSLLSQRRVPSIAFLGDLPELYTVTVDGVLSDADKRLIRRINKPALEDWKKRKG